ncbi:hypothetical protein lerEdw1_006051 [Lerista edwardsae]|nr:hypothetical protein lerEdw1_006051 [Lerista edwardsae]
MLTGHQPQRRRPRLLNTCRVTEMKAQLVWCVALLVAGQTDGKIHQPPSLVVANGMTALLECQQNYNHDSMYWYRQLRNKPGLQLLYYSIYNTHEQRETNSDRFTARRLNNTDFHLSISSASPEDSATYFCASSSHSSYWYLLQRTKIVLPAFLALQRGREEEGCSSTEIWQTWGLAQVEGQNASLDCNQTNGHSYMYWYRQKAGQEPQFLFYFYNTQLQSKENAPDRFTAAQPQKEKLRLMISPVKPEDSAVYFCASSSDTAFQSNLFFLQ